MQGETVMLSERAATGVSGECSGTGADGPLATARGADPPSRGGLGQIRCA